MSLKNKFKLATLTALVGVGVAGSPAWASNLPFTLTPNDALPSLTTNTGTITADTLVGSDNATITVTSAGDGVNASSTEVGTINWVSASLGGISLNAAQLAGLNSGGADNWTLTAQFTAVTPVLSYAQLLSATGAPIALNFNLLGNGSVLLAKGATTGTASLNGPPINPTLSVAGTFDIQPGEGPGAGTFFTSPNPFYIVVGASATAFALSNISTNCATGGPGLATFLGTAGATCTIGITSGGTVAGFSVPEPETIGLMGIGLVGLWFGRRKVRS